MSSFDSSALRLDILTEFVRSLPEAFELLEVVFDKEGNIIDFIFRIINPAFEAQTGLKAANIIGKFKKETAPASEQRWYDYAIRAIKTGQTLTYEYYNDIINRYCETEFIPVANNHLAVLFKDITEKKIAEIMLIESEKKYRALVNATNTGYLIIDNQGNVVDANEEYVRLTGRKSLSEIIGRKVIEWTAYSDKESNKDALGKCLRDGFIKDFIIHYTDGAGRITPVEINAAVISFNSAQQIISLCRDISVREKAEEALRESEQKYKQLVERLPEMVLEIDTTGRVIFVNPRVIEITGYSKAELESNFDANRFVAPEDIERSKQNMKMSFSGDIRHSNEYTFIKKDGTRFPVLLNSVPIIKDGSTIGARGIIIDLTEIKKLENQLKESERLAAIGTTAGWVGHDIRNPLQAMLSDAYLITDYFTSVHDSPAKKEIVESIHGLESNIAYINKIIADLQDYSRPLKPESINFNVYQLVTDVFIPFELPQNIEISIDISPSLVIKSDPTIVKRILTNLIINAFQAMSEGGKLTIDCEDRAAAIILLVEDTGVGIPEAVKPKLFTPMTTTKSKGQGLGLAVVKRLVDGLKGKIDFESQEGKGTRFTIELPKNNNI